MVQFARPEMRTQSEMKGEVLVATSGRHKRALVAAGVVSLLFLLALQLVFSVRRNSITWDEDDHIYAGYMSWKHADFGLNPEHPPLVKMLAALPLLRLPLKMPEMQDRFFKLQGFLGGKDFLFKNDADSMLFRARMAASLLTLLLALLVFLAAQEMFGTGAAFIALSLLVFDPNLLAHGALVGTDVGLSCFMFASLYAFYRYVKAPSPWRLVVVGIATGLALASKHTGILVFPMLFLLAICEVAGRGHVREDAPEDRERVSGDERSKPRVQQAIRLSVALVVVSIIAVAVLWAFYGFRYQARPEGLQLDPPLADFLHQLSRPREARLLADVAQWRLLPESYIYGLADVRIMSDFYTSFLLGEIYPHGVWFYFPVAIAIKSSLTFLVLLVLAVAALATRQLAFGREVLFLTIPPLFYLLIAMGAGMNIGVRHILPMYMFLTVLLAGAAWAFIKRDRRWAYAIALVLVFQAVSSARTFPVYLAYSNELWGGPSNTYKYLSDSNSDWGQQLKATKQYLDGRGIKNCWFVYFAEGVVDSRYYGIPCKPLPTMDTLWVNEPMEVPAAIDGPVLVSAGDLSGFEFGAGSLNPYEQFKQLRPAAVIQYGVFVFEGHFEIPLAAALIHAQSADNLLTAKRLPEALSEAQQAVALAPTAVKPNAVLGDVLIALQRRQEGRESYEKALRFAKTIEPEFQVSSAAMLEQKLAEK
jgi:tetratricopeptide (TPR) repeat protein